MTRDEYIASHKPSPIDILNEDEALQRASSELQLAIDAQKLNWNRLVFVRIAYKNGVFNDDAN